MKRKCSYLSVFLFISLVSGLFALQPVKPVLALHPVQTQDDQSGSIAYIGKDGNVWLANSDGNDKQQLTFDGGFEELVWAPDGQHLALTKSFSDDSYNFKIDISATNIQR